MSHVTEQFSPAATETSRRHTEEMKSKASELKQNVQDLGNQARMAAREQVENIKQTAGQYVEQGREQMESLKSTAADYMEQGRHRAIEMERTLESQIRAQPMRSVLIAAGIGLVAGILLSRR
jgi:ElaB/YqjD/DUF883 family membrane-anchored ribosome-binding protein